jgi:hypothetical protein
MVQVQKMYLNKPTYNAICDMSFGKNRMIQVFWKTSRCDEAC